jgi:hypothetical protein
MASVLYDFDSRYGDELSVKAGDSLQVLAFVDSEWVKCRFWNGFLAFYMANLQRSVQQPRWHCAPDLPEHLLGQLDDDAHSI